MKLKILELSTGDTRFPPRAYGNDVRTTGLYAAVQLLLASTELSTAHGLIDN